MQTKPLSFLAPCKACAPNVAPSLEPAAGRRRLGTTGVGRSSKGLFAIVLAIAVYAAGPAYAQSAGGDLGAFIQNIIDLLNADIIRGLAVLAVILTGVAWMFGQIDLRRAGTVVVGIIVIFGAGTIVDMIVGGA